MYPFLLALHSLVRWLVLTSLIIAVVRAFQGWKQYRTYTRTDERLRLITTSIAHIQLVLGVGVYFISPVVNYFVHHFKDAVQMREIRFFGMEHITMMLTAIVLITIGAAKVKRKTTDEEKFKTMAIWFSIALFIILTSIPWSFSPLVHRPNYRPF